MNAGTSEVGAASCGWPPPPEGLTLIRTCRSGAASAALMRLAPGLEVAGYRAGRPRVDLVVRGFVRRWDRHGELRGGPGSVMYRDPDAEVSGCVGGKALLTFGIALPEGTGEGDRSGAGHPAVAGLAYRAWRAFVRADSASALELESVLAEIEGAWPQWDGLRRSPRRWLSGTIETLERATDRTPTLSELADEAGVHFTHVARTFRRRVGCTPGEYLRLVRLRRVAEALACGDEPIARLAASHVFADQSHLGRHFKRVYGDTPARFRRRFRV